MSEPSTSKTPSASIQIQKEEPKEELIKKSVTLPSKNTQGKGKTFVLNVKLNEDGSLPKPSNAIKNYLVRNRCFHRIKEGYSISKAHYES